MARALEETRAVEMLLLPVLGKPRGHRSALLRLCLPVGQSRKTTLLSFYYSFYYSSSFYYCPLVGPLPGAYRATRLQAVCPGGGSVPPRCP